MSSDEVVIDVRALSKRYEIYGAPRDRLKQLVIPPLHDIAARAALVLGGRVPRPTPRYFHEFWALRDVTFQMRRGESLGVIGRNGSGKSTLLHLICGTLAPTSGDIKVKGRISALLELGSGFNPEYSGRDNVFLSGQILGLSRGEIEARYDAIVDFAEIGEFIDQPVKTYSSGMTVRLAFATQTALEPDVLIVDEALAVGDMPFQIRCFARMTQLRERGTTILFVSHSLATVTSFCERGLYLRKGEQVAVGPAAEIARQYEQDCIADQMKPRDLSPASQRDLPGESPTDTEDAQSLRSLVSATMNGRDRFAKAVANGTRQGTGAATIESFAILRDDKSVAEAISPVEELNACFLVRFNRSLSADVHMSLIVHDKSGKPLMAVRDSHFQEFVQVEPGERVLATMKFRLPLQAGIYYGKVGLLLYPKGQKYSGGQHNFESAEIADLVEQAVHFEILPFAWHSIHVPVLAEAKMSSFRIDG